MIDTTLFMFGGFFVTSPPIFLLNSFGHADGTGRTDETAKVTADALGAHQTGATGFVVKYDGLMAAIATGYLTAATTDAQLLVELRIDDGVTVQMAGIQELLQPLAHEFAQLRNTTLGHKALQAKDEVIDDAVAVLHHGGAHLHVAAAQLDELQGVAPRLNAANAAQF